MSTYRTNTVRECPVCSKTYTPELFKDTDTEGYLRYIDGVAVQDAFPFASPEHREQLVSGVCTSKCWNILYGNDNYIR